MLMQMNSVPAEHIVLVSRVGEQIRMGASVLACPDKGKCMLWYTDGVIVAENN